MSRAVAWMDRALYPAHVSHWDDLALRDAVLAHASAEDRVLDLGAGAGIVKELDLRGRVGRICGIDLDPRVLENPLLDEGRLANAGSIPYPDQSFEVVFSSNVLEHLADPVEVFREVRRVLVPGGLFIAKTPNRWHYFALIAAATPHRFHQFFLRRLGRAPEDAFPTLYRANSRAALRRIARQSELELTDVQGIEGRPGYTRISAATYVLGWLYERLVNSSAALAGMRAVIVTTLRRPE